MRKLAPQEVRTFFVTSVTWGRRTLFQTDRMAALFIDVLGHAREHFLLHEWVLMPNHFHLLVEVGRLSSFQGDADSPLSLHPLL